MAKTRPTRIQLIGEGRHEEGRAAAAITPGMLIALNSAGNLIPHDGDGDVAERLFALEDALQGNGIDVDYASGDLVSYAVSSPGDVVFALLGPGESVDPTDKLCSGGDGTLRAAGSGGEHAVAVPLETIDASDSGETEAVRIRVRIL